MMRHHKNHDRLSGIDTAFLYLEREGVPMHIAGVSELEGIVSYEECVRFITWKIPHIPRYRQRVVAPLFNIGRPIWEFDPEFDVRNHVREVTLKRGTGAEFKALSAKILSQRMDRRRPLWDITLVRGLKGNRTGFITRVHHCLADGVSGVDLMNVVLGPRPVAAPKGRPRFRVPPSRDPWAGIVDDWINSYTSIVDQALSTQADILNLVERIVSGRGIARGKGAGKLLLEAAAPTEALHFNTTVRGPQQLAWLEVPLAEIKALKEACECSVNDVALTLVTMAVRRYAQLHGDDIRGRLLRIMVPVNLREEDGRGQLGNQISIMPVTIPFDVQHPRKLLAAVHERTQFLKKSYVAELATLAGGMLGFLPTALQALAGPIATLLPITPFNLVCTNVPGPQVPLYMMHHKMLTWYPYVPIGGDMALNVAVLSYNGKVYFGFSGDVHAAPNIARLEKFLAMGLRELKSAVGIRTRRRAAVAKQKPGTTVQAEPAQAIPAAAPPSQTEPVSEDESVAAVA
ncbi:MAG: wax ester/triacylglycerol synthase family O-acyltransferase [Actinomycetota bacterium]